MKKVVLSLAVLFAAALVSCGGNKEANAEEATADTTMTEEVAAPVPADTAVVAPADTAAAAPADTAANKAN